MYAILWEYQIKPTNRTEFETIYAPSGAWAEIFKKGTGYLGTELIQSDQSPHVYITIDRWDSKESYNLFLQQWKSEYELMDKQSEGLTLHEKRIGGFRQVPS